MTASTIGETAAGGLRLGMTTPIQEYELDILFTHFMRFRTFLEEAATIVTAGHFHPVHEAAYLYLWLALEQLRTSNSQVTLLSLCHTVRTTIDGGGDFIDGRQIDDLLRQDGDGIIFSAMAYSDRELDLACARGILQKFLKERLVVDGIRRLPVAADGGYAPDVEEALTSLVATSQRIAGFRTIPAVPTVPVFGGPLAPALTMRSSGVDFIDAAVGARADASVVAILGVVAGGKTTLAAQLAVKASEQAILEAGGGPPKKVVFASYEQPMQAIQPRIWSCAFNIERRVLETLSSWDVLSTTGHPKPYEQTLYPGMPPRDIPGERERWLAAAPNLEKTLMLLDMSGVEETSYAGSGGVPELANICNRIAAESAGIRDIVIDWAGIMCERAIPGDLVDNKLRWALKTMVGDLGILAARHQCCVYIMHQMRAAAGGLSPVKFFHHTDAAESKAFAERATVCGCLGVPHARTAARTLNWSKARNLPDSEVPRQIVRINPIIAKFELSPFVIVADDFISTTEAAQVQGMGNPGAPPQTPPASRPRAGRVVADAVPDFGGAS